MCRVCGCGFGKFATGRKDQPDDDLDRAILAEQETARQTYVPGRLVRKPDVKLDPARVGATADAEANLMKTLEKRRK